MQHTKQILPRNSDTCQEKPTKKFKKPFVSRLNYFQSYIFIDKQEQLSSSVYINAFSEGDLIDCLSPNMQKVFAFLFMAKKTYRRVYFSRRTIGNALGMCERHVARALKQLKAYGLISYLSGKKYYRTNLYFVKPIMFTKYMKKTMKKLISCIWDMAPKAWLEQCPTKLRSIILRVVHSYNKYINPTQNLVQQASCMEQNNVRQLCCASAAASNHFQVTNVYHEEEWEPENVLSYETSPFNNT